MHWASDKFSELESVVSGTGWVFKKPSSDTGPIVFLYADCSEVSIVNSSIIGMFAVEYEPEQGVTEAVSDKHEAWRDLDNAMEGVVHILERHEKLN